MTTVNIIISIVIIMLTAPPRLVIRRRRPQRPASQRPPCRRRLVVRLMLWGVGTEAEVGARGVSGVATTPRCASCGVSGVVHPLRAVVPDAVRAPPLRPHVRHRVALWTARPHMLSHTRAVAPRASADRDELLRRARRLSERKTPSGGLQASTRGCPELMLEGR